VRPEQYHEKPQLLCGYYTYWSGLPMDSRFETYVRPDRAFAAWPTHDGLTLVIGGWPFAELEANRKDIEGNYLAMLEMAPAFAERVRGATALDQSFPGACSFDIAMGKYQSTRDRQVLPMFEFTTELATLEPPPPELQQLLGAVHSNQDAMDRFTRVIAVFSEQNLQRITSQAAATTRA
jgi:hypothetical protein